VIVWFFHPFQFIQHLIAFFRVIASILQLCVAENGIKRKNWGGIAFILYSHFTSPSKDSISNKGYPSFSFACPKENEAKEKGTNAKNHFDNNKCIRASFPASK
jgi:hypothetical protein